MLGDKVKNLRNGKKITQETLAKAIGLSQSTIGMIEKNKQGTSRKTLIKLADFFDVSVDYLLSEKEEINEENNSLKFEKPNLKRESLNIGFIPEEFIDANQAREYVDKHQIFGAHGFNPDLLSDDEIIKFANELQQQMQMVSLKYKK